MKKFSYVSDRKYYQNKKRSYKERCLTAIIQIVWEYYEGVHEFSLFKCSMCGVYWRTYMAPCVTIGPHCDGCIHYREKYNYLGYEKCNHQETYVYVRLLGKHYKRAYFYITLYDFLEQLPKEQFLPGRMSQENKDQLWHIDRVINKDGQTNFRKEVGDWLQSYGKAELIRFRSHKKSAI